MEKLLLNEKLLFNQDLKTKKVLKQVISANKYFVNIELFNLLKEGVNK